VTGAAELGWRGSRWKRLQIATIGALGYPLIRVLGSTWRWRVDGMRHLDAIHAAGRQPLMAFWHGRILPSLYYFRNRGIVVITSDNFDGEWIAKIIHRFGYTTVRGSTSRNAARAALRAKRRLEQGSALGVTVDGPRGPALVAQPGAVWLAGATGSPILPFHIEAYPHWVAPSWDLAQIPLPFSRVVLVLGEPIWVPRAADDAALEDQRAELERVLLALRCRALTLLGRTH
jgi:lysophospholipid acyltransferase (LPLAT)-like uncharacterized protein